MPSPQSSPNRPPKQGNSPKRSPLHERSQSQTNELSQPRAKNVDVYASTPFPTKPEHVLVPSNAPGPGVSSDEENGVSDPAPPRPLLEHVNKGKDKARWFDHASERPTTSRSASNGPTLSLRRSVAALRDLYESQAAPPSLSPSPTLKPRREVSNDGLRGLDRFVTTVSDNVVVVNDPAPSTIKRVASDSSLSQSSTSPIQPSSPVVRAAHDPSSPGSSSELTSSSPNVVRIAHSPSPSPGYSSNEYPSEEQPPSEPLSDLIEFEDPPRSSSIDEPESSSSPNLVPVGPSSSPNFVKVGPSSPVALGEKPSDSSLSSLDSLDTVKRHLRHRSEDQPSSSTFPTSSTRFSSSPPEPVLREYASTSTLDLHSSEPTYFRPTTPEPHDTDPYHTELEAIDESSPAPSIHYPVVHAPAPSAWAEIHVPKRAPRLMSDSASGRWDPHLSTIPSEWSAERAQSAPSVGPPEQTSWPERPQPPFARRRDTTGSTIRAVSETDYNEAEDVVGDLGRSQPRPKASGFFSIISSSDSRSNSLRGSLRRPTSNSSLASSIGIPGWARRYYSQIGARDSIPSTGQYSSASPPGTATSQPSDTHFPLGIFRPRTRAHGERRPSSPKTRAGPLTSNPSGPSRPRPASIPIDPADPRSHWAGAERAAIEAAVQNPPTRSRIVNEWSPHLYNDNRAARRSLWHAPSLDEKAEGIFTRRNAQVFGFILGFVIPLSWFIASFLPLPPKPRYPDDDLSTNESQDLEASLAHRINLVDEIRYENARWWRNLNRFMCFVGVAVIVLVVCQPFPHIIRTLH